MKTKTKNKILLSILSVFLLIGIVNVSAISVGSEAGNSDPNSRIITDTAELSITGVVSGDQFKAYKILDAYYNQTTNVVSYEFTDDFQAFLNQSSNSTYQKLKVDDLYSYSSGNISTGSTLSNSDIEDVMNLPLEERRERLAQIQQKNCEVQDYAVSSVRYWTRKTNQILNLYTAQALKNINEENPDKALKMIKNKIADKIFKFCVYSMFMS